MEKPWYLGTQERAFLRAYTGTITQRRRRTVQELSRNDPPANFKESPIMATKPVKPANGSTANWTPEAQEAYEKWLAANKQTAQPSQAVAKPRATQLPLGLNLIGKTRVVEIPEEVSALVPFITSDELQGYDHFYISNAILKTGGTYGDAVWFTVHVQASYAAPGQYAPETWTPSPSQERLNYVKLFATHPEMVIGPCYLADIPNANPALNAYKAIRNVSERTTIEESMPF